MKDTEAVEVKVHTFLNLTLLGHSNELHTLAVFIPIDDDTIL
jgi:hypothetical protein